MPKIMQIDGAPEQLVHPKDLMEEDKVFALMSGTPIAIELYDFTDSLDLLIEKECILLRERRTLGVTNKELEFTLLVDLIVWIEGNDWYKSYNKGTTIWLGPKCFRSPTLYKYARDKYILQGN